MQVGVNLPVMAPGFEPEAFFRWCELADASSLAHIALGERIHFSNPEMMVALSMAAAATSRIGIAAYVMVLPLHHSVLAAKQLATLDRYSGGRLTVGLGIGGRDEDYFGLDVDLARKKWSVLAGQVEEMRRLWRGELVFDGAMAAVEPAPMLPQGPRLLAGAVGPKAVAMAAAWADGLCGFSFGPDFTEIDKLFTLARSNWQVAERKSKPFLGTGFWFSLQGEAAMHSYLRRYLNFIPAAYRENLVNINVITNPQSLRDALRRCEELGADEVSLVPVDASSDELQRLLDVLG